VDAQHQAILKDVSRSFYLSIRFLPGPMRETVALGYLIARLTDTVADSTALSEDIRTEWLDRIRKRLQGDLSAFEALPESMVDSIPHPGEQILAMRAPELFAWLESLGPVERAHLDEVLLTIVHGQIWDTTFFSEHQRSCRDEGDLLRYTYWVAGCVGEFWTKVGFTTLERGFSDPDNASEMLVSGRRLGQALQLINILRDLHEDLPAGRCYLPEDELKAAGWSGEEMPRGPELEPVFEEWLTRCETYLEDAEGYVQKIRNSRVRFCTRLPMLLARATVEEIRMVGLERVLREKVRISRATVWKEMLRAIFF